MQEAHDEDSANQLQQQWLSFEGRSKVLSRHIRKKLQTDSNFKGGRWRWKVHGIGGGD